MGRWLVMLIVTVLAGAGVAVAWRGADGGDDERVQPIEIVPHEDRPEARERDRRGRRGRSAPDRRGVQHFQPAPESRLPTMPQPAAPQPAPAPAAPAPSPPPAPAPPAPSQPPAPAPPTDDDDGDDGGGDDDDGDDDDDESDDDGEGED